MPLDVASFHPQSLHYILLTRYQPVGLPMGDDGGSSSSSKSPHGRSNGVSLSPQQDRSKSWFGSLNCPGLLSYPPRPDPIPVAKDDIC